MINFGSFTQRNALDHWSDDPFADHSDQWSDESLSRVDLIDHWSEKGFAPKECHRLEILIRILPKERSLTAKCKRSVVNTLLNRTQEIPLREAEWSREGKNVFKILQDNNYILCGLSKIVLLQHVLLHFKQQWELKHYHFICFQQFSGPSLRQRPLWENLTSIM